MSVPHFPHSVIGRDAVLVLKATFEDGLTKVTAAKDEVMLAHTRFLLGVTEVIDCVAAADAFWRAMAAFRGACLDAIIRTFRSGEGSCHLARLSLVSDHIREVHEAGPFRDARLDEYWARIEAAGNALLNHGTTSRAIYRSFNNASRESFFFSDIARVDGIIDAFTYSIDIRRLVDVLYMTTTAHLKEEMCSYISYINAHDLHHP
jgi:hypothetical protein